jgi:hypothetical protein
VAQQWHFEQDAQQQWHWKLAENEAESAKSFKSATECMLDAVRFAVNRRRARAELGGEELLQ